MRMYECRCGWSYVVGKKRVYGPIYRTGIGDFPNDLAPSQRMMTRKEWKDRYGDCAVFYADQRRQHELAKR